MANQVGLAEPRFGSDGLYWLEGRPLERGRVAVVSRRWDGTIEDVTPSDSNARTRVHEMGGGAYAIDQTSVYFSEDSNQRIFKTLSGSQPIPITPEPVESRSVRYSDARLTPDGSLLVAVRETHSSSGVTNELVVLATDGGSDPKVLVSGCDFYSSPRISPDGGHLLWLSWNHPRMPWDGTELWVADFDGARVGTPGRVAGGPEESIFQPEWSPGGDICFISDRTGWWNLYREIDGEVKPLHSMAAEFGEPQWVFGLARYAFVDDSRIVCTYTSKGTDHLALVGIDGSDFLDWPVPYSSIAYVASDGKGAVAMIAGSSSRAPELVLGTVEARQFEVIRQSLAVEVDAAYLSTPDHIEFPTSGSRTAFAFFYPPTNPEHEGGENSPPPLIVTSHGGPTGAASSGLNLSIQFWTSRGFAVVDVNYGGSTGYGRGYRSRLDGQWGVVDVDDCVHAATYLARRHRVDESRMAIRGKSASGLTTLCALEFHDVFTAGAIYYGVADLEGLAADTHKFESRYMDKLIGPYPEAKERYQERSPILHTDALSAPVIVFQGLEDKIVPPSQAEVMIQSLRRKGLPFAYVTFPGEQHGFRQAATIKRALEGELYFYSRVFGFEPADALEAVAIENMDS
jgi:dipeptidyl aminopeptidase/acylaminoacyl peptidase